MKKLIFVPAITLLAFVANAQNYKMILGEEVKLKKGTGDLDIIAADNSGLYFTEERRATTMLNFGGNTTAHRLYKLDKNFGEVFDKDYKKELKGLAFQGFQEMGKDLFIFATDYERKTRSFKVYGSKVDRNSGELVGDFTELGDYDLESRKDDYEMKVTRIKNGNAFLMVSNISAKDRVSIGICLLDKNLKKIENTVIDLSFQPNLYQLQDVQYTQNNKIILLGKEFEEAQIGKKKKKRLVFKQYVMGIYNNKGQKEKDVALNADDRYIISGKLIEQASGDLLLAGFYSNAAKKEDLNGFFINKVNPETGALLVSSFKEINSGMLGKSYEDEGDDDEEAKEIRKELKKARDNDEEEEFPNNFIIRSVDINPSDNSVIITSEVSKYYFNMYTSYNYNTRSYNTTYTHRFINQDVLLIHADKDGNIKWLNVLPKSQSETVRTSGNSPSSLNYDWASYFAHAGGMPFYSSYKSFLQNNSLYIVMNDHTSNNVNPGYGDKVKTVTNFRKKSNVYGVSIDLATGKMTRKIIGSNNEETILMPRHAYLVNNELFVPSWRMRVMAKTELRFAKITVK